MGNAAAAMRSRHERERLGRNYSCDMEHECEVDFLLFKREKGSVECWQKITMETLNMDIL